MKPQTRLSGAARSILHYLYLKAGEIRPLRISPVQADWNAALWGTLPRGAAFPRIAFLCDEMTWQDFGSCCNGIFLHPRIWREQLERFSPDLLFCEAAWTGIKAFEGVWRGRVYRDRRLWFDNRGILLDLLAYCRQRGIPTVFWGKEDPVFFRHPVYDFTQTALSFDVVFTTAVECVERYRALGHPRVELLPFGVDTARFHPGDSAPEPNTAVFAGSWFSDQPERCAALERLLDFTLDQGLRLEIYNRKSNARQARFRFPDKYQAYLRPAVPYEQTAALFRRYAYAVNVNTVTNSATMCSRRLLQLAASGTVVITNDTPALDTLSDCLEVSPAGVSGLMYVRGDVERIASRYALRRQLAGVLACCGLDAAELEEERMLHGAPVG